MVLPRREELPREVRWDIESVFPSEEAWEAAYRAMAGRLGELDEYRGRLGESAATLLAGLRRRDELAAELGKVGVYARLRRAEDATNATSAALSDRAASLQARFAAAAAFYDPEILALDPATLDRYVAEEQGLAVYRHYFAKLGVMRGHIRSPEVEETLAEARDVTGGFATIRGALENADLDLGTIADEEGRSVRLRAGNLQRFQRSADRAVRRAAWETSADAYLSMQHTFAGTLIGAIKRDVFYARARRFDSSLEAALAPHAIPVEVFHNLVDTVWKNLPVWHRYFALRRRILGYDTLHGWDLTAPLERNPPTIPFERGVEIIARGLAPMGRDYVDIVRQGAAERWVDRGANVGKGGGAFSSGVPGTHPFVSMTYQDTLQSVSTLAHELGHSLHSYHTWRAQPPVYARYSMFVAETASNMHQALLGAHLLETVRDPDFLVTVIEERMGNHLRYLFTMPILAKFELDCHERVERGEALTAEGMTATLAELYRQGYGGEVAFDAPRMGITWARFGHLFSNFYVFQYATGIAAAAALARQVREEGEPAARRYIDFLSTGDAAFPIDALRAAGVDMRDPAPVQAAFDILAGYVDRLERVTSDER
ncbi:MAG TPA: oligoendopeptidase F [Thermomicrobiales bacterium]|nr:oligoendopeptidase F [Thermomicrobiales bacterium]